LKERARAKNLVLLFDEILSEWTALSSSRAVAGSEIAAEELRLPSETGQMLLLAVPVVRLGLYREEIYPAAVDLGFGPIASVEVASPDDSVLATTTALIERAEVFLADLTGGSSAAAEEFELALHRGRRWVGIGVVVSSESSPTRLAPDVQVFKDQPTDISAEGRWPLAASIRSWLSSLGSTWKESSAQATRLLELGQPTAAVIFAFRRLEKALRLALEMRDPGPTARRATLRQLLSQARSRQVITAAETAAIENWIGLRNLAVHGATEVPAQTSRAAVRAIDAISARLESRPR